jgi:hypothetical protein
MPTGEGFHEFYRNAYPRLVAQLYAHIAQSLR